MSAVVVDASVVIKWFFPEVHGDQALHIRDTAKRFVVPDLLYAEVGNVLWHRVQTGAITREEAQAVIEALNGILLPSSPVPTKAVLASALEIACQTGTTVYDSLYLALALQERIPCVTADRRFFDRMQDSPFAPYIAWITAPFPASLNS